MANKALQRALSKQAAWHLVDLHGQVLGRAASEVAKLLMGKWRLDYHPGRRGDYVVCVNAAHVVLTGKKRKQKVYRWHTGYPGGLKTVPVERMMERRTTEVFRKAVMGMLPKNRIRHERARALYIFPEEDHPFMDKIREYAPVWPVDVDIPILRSGTTATPPREEYEDIRKESDLIEDLKSLGIQDVKNVDALKVQAESMGIFLESK